MIGHGASDMDRAFEEMLRKFKSKWKLPIVEEEDMCYCCNNNQYGIQDVSHLPIQRYCPMCNEEVECDEDNYCDGCIRHLQQLIN